jgi:hypothetical protein
VNDLEELKRLAQEATPGPWYAGEKERWQMADGRFIRTSVDKSGTALVLVGNSNADFIAAANPAAVLALIERVETLEWNYAQTVRDNQHLERDIETMTWERDQAKARVSQIKTALSGLRGDVTGALEEAERQSKATSGMSVPYTGPFASGLRLPSVVRDLREQRRILDAALEAK